LHQLLMNLSGNAMKAMREPGELRLCVSQVTLSQSKDTRFGAIGPGTFAQIEVEDTGIGMTPETAQKIFEPFFSSRDGGYGDSMQAQGGRSYGLGLAIVHSIVTEHRGAIEVRSQPNQGTCFTVLLPAAVALTTNADRDESQLLGQGEVVMIVDDEAQIVAVLEETLAELGFEPIGFANAELAWDAFTQNPDRFDLVVSDEVMPGMSGTDLIGRLKEQRPQLRTIIASAYGGLGFETRALSAGVDRVLRKPYQRSELIEVIAQLLDRASR
jgi:CheY-like chemotaxis protein